MAGDESVPPADAISQGFVRLVEGLRDDQREDNHQLRAELRDMESRLTARVVAVEGRQVEARDQLVEFVKAHADEHDTSERRSTETHSAIWDAVRKFELNEARRDGALGVTRYTIELVSKHAPRLATILLAIAAAAGVATGAVSVSVGT
jgi:hypothetical protein